MSNTTNSTIIENAGDEFLEALSKFNEVLDNVIQSTEEKKRIIESLVKNGDEIKNAINNYKK